MTTEGESGRDHAALEITLDGSYLPVSALSSLLRVVQAAVREVARTDDVIGQQFRDGPEPILLVSGLTVDRDLTLRLGFVDRAGSAPLPELSDRAFESLLDRFGLFVRRLPQPGLWGASARVAHQGEYESPLEMRMDKLRMELRRFPKSALRFRGRTIRVEGDQVNID